MMNRVTAVLLVSLGVCTACSREDPRPNVVFISVDTLRADHTTPYGYARDTTPALARIAREGTLFERAYAMSSWTLPSMSMLVTGEIKPLADQAILPGHEAVAETFQRAGYRTAGVLANPLLTADYGYDRGLDRYVVAPADPTVKWTAREVLDQGLRWLEETDETGAPYFLWLHPIDPHWPYAPEDGRAFYDPVDPDAWRSAAARSLASQHVRGLERADPSRLTAAACERILRNRDLYDADVLQFDRQVARLLEVLAERGELETTLIVVTSDHGEGLWQRATNPDDRKGNAVFASLYDGHGAQLYEEQVRVPLVFRGPGVPRGVRVQTAVDLVDVTPSILALADVPVTRGYDGTSLFGDGVVDVPDQGVIVSVCSRLRTITVDGRWRLHEPRPHRLGQDLVEPRLYDLENDPLELSPVDDPARIAELQARLEAWHREHAPDGGAAARMTPERIQLLRSLGYGGEAEHVLRMIENLEEEADQGSTERPGSGGR